MLKTEALTPLFHFRKELYDNLGLRQDSLFELVDALLTNPQRSTLVRLSLCPVFRRRWPSTCDALADGFVGLVFLIPGFGLVMAGGGEQGLDQESPLAIAGVVLCIVGILALFGLQLYLLATRSQSIGKYLVKTQIYDYETDAPASFTKCFLMRVLVNGFIGALPCIGGIYSLVDILFIFGEEHRCLHDQIAGTYVVDIS